MADNSTPKHVAIIMDGNRRWAKKKGMPVVAGHKFVVEELVERLIEHATKRGVEYLTLWAFSTENWKRDAKEVTGVLSLFRWALEKRAKRLIEKGARVQMIGDMSRFPDDIRKGFEKMVEESKDNSKITVTFALNYGGRDEISRSFEKILKSMTNDHFSIFNDMVEGLIGENLDTAKMPDPDLIIRPGGEQRLSGFMLWQSAYSELYFTDTLMPDFDESEFDKALEECARRQRRFGA